MCVDRIGGFIVKAKDNGAGFVAKAKGQQIAEVEIEGLEQRGLGLSPAQVSPHPWRAASQYRARARRRGHDHARTRR
jgi:hypothetical protein